MFYLNATVLKPRRFISLLFYAALLLLVGSCKRYSEDGKLSVESPEKRIRAFWLLKECVVDGVDVVDQEMIYVYNLSGVTDTIKYSLRDASLEFKYYKTKKGGDVAKHYVSYLTINTSNYPISVVSDYNFFDHHNKLKFSSNYSSYAGNAVQPLLYNQSTVLWDIEKLTDKELRLELTNDKGQSVKLKFVERLS
mgnify:CR=1 FL=1